MQFPELQMNETLQTCLQDLEARIDREQERHLLQQWIDFAAGRHEDGLFAPRRDHASPPGISWPQVSINQALQDWDEMALQQYGACSEQLATGSGYLLNVRCNYGTSIIPLLFGVEPFVMDAELNTLPTSKPLGDVRAIEHIVEAGPPPICGGYTEKVIEMAKRYLSIARDYPKIGECVHIYHPDFQGPMDICEVVWGSTIFYALYDRPDLIKALLEVVTETYIRFMHIWIEIVPFEPEGNAHWGYYHRGNIMLRDDSAMNLSTAMFDEFVRPYDQRLLDEFGGGAIHFCGKGDHYIARASRMRGLYAVQMSQPEYNDMETIYAHTVDRGINLIGLDRATAESAIAQGRDLHGRVNAF
jgi:hypothetical protein